MKKLLILIILHHYLYAMDEDHVEHEKSGYIRVNLESLNFTHSKKKEDGKRVGFEFDYQALKHHYQLFYEKTDTATKKIVPKDLKVDKLIFKYGYKLNSLESVSLSYMLINDNLMKETDDGRIYGLGYKHGKVGFNQYFSDYKRFDVYESDLAYRTKVTMDSIVIMGMVEGKYIHLVDKNSNSFSKRAKDDYFSVGLKVHTHYKGYHFGVGTYQGKRIFSVMQEGFKTQHHAMEFKESYMLGVGHKIGSAMVHLRYNYSKADEIVSNNKNVKVDSLSLDIAYKLN